MAFRIVVNGWERELSGLFRACRKELRLICPFIKAGTLERLLTVCPAQVIRVITRFNLGDFAEGVSDISSLRLLLERGAEIRGVKNLHAKLYVSDADKAVVTSANLTKAALGSNHEFGFVVTDGSVVTGCVAYFDDLWARSKKSLQLAELDLWERKVARQLAAGAWSAPSAGLSDLGVDAGDTALPVVLPPWVGESRQAFVKFHGTGEHRASPTERVLEEVRSAGCHRVLAYPKRKRPRQVEEGALMFIGVLARHPNDVRIIGRAIGMKHLDGRDDATKVDIRRRGWMSKWPHFVRVHHAEFLYGIVEDGVSLNELMDTLKADSFSSTQRNKGVRGANRNPRMAYRQRAAVELTNQARVWLSRRVEAAFRRHGILDLTSAKLDWPAASRSGSVAE